MDEEARFMEQVAPITESGCWIYMGKTQGLGYGTFPAFGRKTIRAHRWSYDRFVGPIPAGLVVRHTCDVACCVNPKHLILGTQAENIQDKVSKGRQAKGSRMGHAKLNEESVRVIRSRLNPYRHGIYTELAKEFGVHRAIIARIDANKVWKHA
jgi:hypothetical protein